MGKVRSVAMANELRDYGFDAFAVGSGHSRALKMGARWADLIIIVPGHLDDVRKKAELRDAKCRIMNAGVGRDVWLDPTHLELKQIVREWVANNIATIQGIATVAERQEATA